VSRSLVLALAMSAVVLAGCSQAEQGALGLSGDSAASSPSAQSLDDDAPRSPLALPSTETGEPPLVDDVDADGKGNVDTESASEPDLSADTSGVLIEGGPGSRKSGVYNRALAVCKVLSERGHLGEFARIELVRSCALQMGMRDGHPCDVLAAVEYPRDDAIDEHCDPDYEIRQSSEAGRAPEIGVNSSVRVVRGCRIERGTVCPGASLSGADLRGADLRDADLRGADLVQANLGRADLVGANLARANLWGAFLLHATLFHANLRGANLSQAQFVAPDIFSGADTMCMRWIDGSMVDGERRTIPEADVPETCREIFQSR